MLIRVETCGICHTDLKKIEYNLLPPPRIYGHETAGVVVAAVERRRYDIFSWRSRHRVSSYSLRRLFLLPAPLICAVPGYKKSRGHGRVRARRRRLRAICARDGLDCRDAAWRAFPTASASTKPAGWNREYLSEGRRMLNLEPGDVVAVLGQGPIGLIFTMLVRRTGATVVASDTIPYRLELSSQAGRRPRLIRARPAFERTLESSAQTAGAPMLLSSRPAPKGSWIRR